VKHPHPTGGCSVLLDVYTVQTSLIRFCMVSDPRELNPVGIDTPQILVVSIMGGQGIPDLKGSDFRGHQTLKNPEV
jgi:hypothetical protein